MFVRTMHNAIYGAQTDMELVKRLRDGDHHAYEVIYQQYFRLLFSFAYKKVKDKEQAKDIIQELFTNLWVKRIDLNFNTSFSGYLFTAVNNRIVDYFLHKEVEGKYVASLASFLSTDHSKPDHQIREKQLAAQIEYEIQQLPDKMKEIFELSRKQFLSHREIAEKLGISEKTVNRQVSNALLRLKMKLGLAVFVILLLKS